MNEDAAANPIVVESFLCRCKTEIRFHVLEGNASLSEEQTKAMNSNNIFIVKKGQTIKCPHCTTEITIK